jgi:Glycosyl transferases group 1
MTDGAATNWIQDGATPPVFAVWTRELDGQPMAGRLRIALNIRRVISADGDYQGAIMPSLLSHRTWRRLLENVWALVDGLVHLKPLPLQCILFSAKSDIDDMCRRIPRDGVIYMDGIRLFALARRLRAERPTQRIVMDFDDLLSRRADLLLKGGLPLSPGYLTEKLSPFVRRLIFLFSRWILIYDRAALRRIELEALEITDATVLLSTEDSRTLEALAGPVLAQRVHNIPPAVTPPTAVPRPFDKVERFIFVGTDGLTQNRLTIDYLIQLWRKHRPATPLVLFGKQWRAVDLPAGVHAAGYVESLLDIYDPQSALLTPSFIRGGVKTKALEAFAHRVPVIGNADTFEGLTLSNYPLIMSGEAELLEFILDPNRDVPTLRRAADLGYGCVQSCYTPEIFAERWRSILATPEGTDHALSGALVAAQR